MKYKLYIDTFFLLNFLMDALLLLLIRKVLRCTATHLRIILGSGFGAGMACVLTTAPFIPAWVKILTGYGMVSICMIKISFSGMNFTMACRAAVYLYGFSFLLGGVLEALAEQIPFFRVYGIGFLGVCVTGLFTYGLFVDFYTKWKKRGGDVVLPVKVVWQGRELFLKALVDTGNSLYEPLGGKPVSIVEKKVMERMFCDGRPTCFRAVPFHSIGKAHGILDGYELTELIIFGKNEMIKIEKPMVGLFDGKLSAGSAYQMILHPTLTKIREESI